jgi:hypothetical protein
VPEAAYVKPPPRMPRHPSEWLKKQFQMQPDERLSAPRPTPEPEALGARTTARGAWMAFLLRQLESEKVSHRNHPASSEKKRRTVDSPGFERLYRRSLRQSDQGALPLAEPERKIRWSNDERWTKPRPATEPLAPEPYPREKLFLKNSQKMSQGKPGIGERAKRDFSDMIEEYRIRAREERLRNEHSELNIDKL